MHAYFLPIETTEKYGTRFDYPVLKPQAASLALKGELGAFFRKAMAFVESHDQIDQPPRLAIRAPASLGKSSSIIDILKTSDLGRYRILYLVPTLELADELQIKALAAGINARVFRGRSALKQGQPVGGEKMCMKSDVAETLSAAGYSVAQTLCQSRVPTGKRTSAGKQEFETVECPSAQTCPYFLQMKDRQPGLIIGSHAYLTTPIEALRQEERIDLVILDEGFAFEASTNGRRVVLTDLLRPRNLPKDGPRYRSGEHSIDDDISDLATGIQIVDAAVEMARLRSKQPLTISEIYQNEIRADAIPDVLIEDILAIYERRGLTQCPSDFFHHVGTLEYQCLEKPELHAAMPIEQQRDLASRVKYRDALAFAAFWKRLSKEISLRSEGLMNGIRTRFDVTVGKGQDARFADCAFLYGPKQVKYDKVPVLVLDASANDLVIEQFFSKFDFVTMQVELPTSVRIAQVADRTGSMTMYRESDRRVKEVYSLMQTLGKWTESESRQDGKDRRPLFIGYKSLHEEVWLSSRLAKGWRSEKGEQIVEAIDGKFSVAHANGVRGVDRWKDTRAIVVAARMEPSPSDVENQARAIFANVGRSIFTGLDQWNCGDQELVAKSGQTVTVKVSSHPDELVDLVLKQIREEELVQCLARARPIHRAGDEPLTMFVLSSIPLDEFGYQADNLVLWSDVMPDEFDRWSLDQKNEVVPDRLADFWHVASRDWSSFGAMKSAFARRTGTSHNLHLNFLKKQIIDGVEPNTLDSQNPYGSKTLLGVYMGFETISSPLAVNEIRVEFRREGSRGLRTATVKFSKDETADDIVLKVTKAFADAHSIIVLGTLPEVAAQAAEQPASRILDTVQHEVPDRELEYEDFGGYLSDEEAAKVKGHFWWQSAFAGRFKVANDCPMQPLTPMSALFEQESLAA